MRRKRQQPMRKVPPQCTLNEFGCSLEATCRPTGVLIPPVVHRDDPPNAVYVPVNTTTTYEKASEAKPLKSWLRNKKWTYA